MKKWLIYTIIALILILLILTSIILLWKWKTKKNNDEIKNKLKGGITLKEIVIQIELELEKQRNGRQKLGIYNLTSDICYKLNINLDYQDEIPTFIKKMSGAQIPENKKNNNDKREKQEQKHERYIIVNGKKKKLKDYIDELVADNKLNENIIQLAEENEQEVLQYVEQYEEEESEFYVEQSFNNAENQYDKIINTISEQQENFKEKTLQEEDIKKIDEQIKEFKDMDEKLKLIDTYYNDIFSMREDLRNNKQEIIEKRNKILKLILCVEMYYEMEDLKKEHHYLPNNNVEYNVETTKDINTEPCCPSTFDSCSTFDTYCPSTFDSCSTFDACCPSTFDSCCPSTFDTCYPSTFDELINEMNKQINICEDKEYLNHVDTDELINEMIHENEIKTQTLKIPLLKLPLIFIAEINNVNLNVKSDDIKKTDPIINNDPNNIISIEDSVKLFEKMSADKTINNSITNNYHNKYLNTNSKNNIIFKRSDTKKVEILFNNCISTYFEKKSRNYIQNWNDIKV